MPPSCCPLSELRSPGDFIPGRGRMENGGKPFEISEEIAQSWFFNFSEIPPFSPFLP